MTRAIVMVAGKDPLEETAGGHSSYVRAHARAAVQAGFQPHLFCVSRSSGIVETEYGLVHRMPSPLRHFLSSAGTGFRVWTMPLQVPCLVAGVASFLHRQSPPHLIHGFGVWGCVGPAVQARMCRRGHDIVALVSAYTSLAHEFRGKVEGLTHVHGLYRRLSGQLAFRWIKHVVARYERQACRQSQALLVNYDAVRRALHSDVGRLAEVRKLPYTSETAFLPAAPSTETLPLAALEPRTAPLLVTVARHDPRKGLHLLLHALAELRAAGVPFRACLVGGGKLLDAHRRLAGQLGLTGNTLLAGVVADPRAFLQHADVFVLPSIQEGSGSVAVIEALQAGLPVVASAIDGLPEDIVHGGNGLLFEPGSVQGLTQALSRLLREDAERRRLAAHARQTFAEKFSPTVLARALADTYAAFGFVAPASPGGGTMVARVA